MQKFEIRMTSHNFLRMQVYLAKKKLLTNNYCLMMNDYPIVIVSYLELHMNRRETD